MQRHVERSARRHGDLVVMILIGGGEGIGIRRAERQARKSDVELSGRRGEGIVGPVGIGELVETVDPDRAAYIKKYFDIEWPARHFFQLMINSAMGDDAVVRTILCSVERFDKRLA